MGLVYLNSYKKTCYTCAATLRRTEQTGVASSF